MKATVQVVVSKCDECGEGGCYYQCINCGREVCFEHRRTMIELHAMVYFQGSGDVYFCPPCYVQPKDEIKPLLRAYQKIAAMTAEQHAYWQDFKKRSGEAESLAKKLYEIAKKGESK